MKLSGNTQSSSVRTFFTVIVLICVVVLSFSWGVLIMHKKIFPYEQLRSAAFAVLGNRLTAPRPRVSFFNEFPTKADVVMIGDSLTEAALWNEIFPKIKIANRGVGRDTTNDVLGRLESIISVEAKKAFLMIGINDIYHGRTIDEIMDDYGRIVSRLQEAGIVVYVQSTVECAKENCGRKLQRVRELNQRLRIYAAKNNIQYIDINKGMTSDADGLLSAFTYDGVHLNGKGFLVWSKMIESQVRSK
ncbi:MAG: GDSL-type esterase/lipase family protein [Gammaproteobacteria bacterium]|nr:GDSL-type esterase/lipase family protein [Gammaproteobacteria bacterium]